ncbi:MAG TPA: protein kinase [Polyangiaceae bacterium]|nr:protein kinase [Polyangiaceae bacterium]
MAMSLASAGNDPFADTIDSFLQQVAADCDPQDGLPCFLRAGTTLSGRFKVESFARRGGMGAIYRGLDLTTDRPVALKVVGRLGRDLRARFAREIGILSELTHPNIVQYLAHGTTAEGTLYLAMEWLEGEDLAERLRRTPLSIEETLTLTRRVCRALATAHARGIVHRDIKPANLFLLHSDPGAVKLLDFGIARLVEGAQPLTTGTARIGTVGYMSPEQAMGQQDLDPRADVFAIGCVFYECLTGKAPFASAHPVAVLAKVLQEEPQRPSEIRSDLDPKLDDFVARMLAKDRRDRPADAGDILETFGALADSVRGTSPKLRRSLSPRRPDQRVVSVILGRSETSSVAPLERDASFELLEVKFGARITPLKGGAILLVLAGQSEANDRASQAVHCALELSQRRPDLMLAVATGLADTSAGIPVGVAIDRAAAMLSEANTAGSVRLDDVTLGLVGLRFEVQRLAGANLLIAARRDFDAPRQLMGRPTPYVGRDREIRALDEALNECVVDHVSRVVIVTGPPGIGKSRLASEWLARGGRGGLVRTLFARVDPRSAGSAWSLVQRLIRDAADMRDAETREAQFTRLREHLTRLFGATENERITEFLAEVLGLRVQSEPSPLLLAAMSNHEVMREQVRRALHEWLDAEAANRPLLLLLEDLHWGDAPSVAFLAEAMREKPHRPLMVLALARPEVEKQFPDFCERAVMQIRLPGLGSRAALELVQAALESKLDSETSARLIRVADGNPFYLEELIRRVALGSKDWPETVLAMAQSRIDRLEPSARCVLLAASVFGEHCWDGGIAEIIDRGLDVQRLLQVLTQEELLLEVSDSRYAKAREYRFRHALLRDASYAMMSREDRVAAHGAVADWLERNGEKDARLLADHFEAAELDERACPSLIRAAKKAIDAGDLQGTIELADRGIALSSSGDQRGRFLLLRCYSETLRGHANVEMAREVVDSLPVGTPSWWMGLGILIFGASMSGNPELAAPYVTLARDAPFSKERDIPMGQALLALVGGLVLLGKASVAGAILERARDAGSPEDPLFEAFLSASNAALQSVAPIGGRWNLERALRECRRCAEALGSLGAFHGQSIALYYTAIAATHLGLYEEARDACLRACAPMHRCNGIRDPWAVLFLARAYIRLGQPEKALEAVEPIRSSADSAVRQMVPVVVAEALLKQGNPRAAEHAVSAALNGAAPKLQRLAASVLARAQLSRNEVSEALRTIELALEVSTSNGLESEIDLMNLRAECLLARGERGSARQVVAKTSELVLAIAAEIESAELKHSFLTNVEPCARALSLFEQLS